MSNWIGRPTNLCYPAAFLKFKVRRALPSRSHALYPSRSLPSRKRVSHIAHTPRGAVARFWLIFPPWPFVATISDCLPTWSARRTFVLSIDLYLRDRFLDFMFIFLCFRSFFAYWAWRMTSFAANWLISRLGNRNSIRNSLFLVVVYSFRAALGFYVLINYGGKGLIKACCSINNSRA